MEEGFDEQRLLLKQAESTSTILEEFDQEKAFLEQAKSTATIDKESFDEQIPFAQPVRALSTTERKCVIGRGKAIIQITRLFSDKIIRKIFNYLEDCDVVCFALTCKDVYSTYDKVWRRVHAPPYLGPTDRYGRPVSLPLYPRLRNWFGLEYRFCSKHEIFVPRSRWDYHVIDDLLPDDKRLGPTKKLRDVFVNKKHIVQRVRSSCSWTLMRHINDNKIFGWNPDWPEYHHSKTYKQFYSRSRDYKLRKHECVWDDSNSTCKRLKRW